MFKIRFLFLVRNAKFRVVILIRERGEKGIVIWLHHWLYDTLCIFSFHEIDYIFRNYVVTYEIL